MTTLPSIGKQFSLSFDLLVSRHKSVKWRNVIHLTAAGENRTGVWIREDNKLEISSGIHDYHGHDPVVEGEWTSLQISQTLEVNKAGRQMQDFLLHRTFVILTHWVARRIYQRVKHQRFAK